MAKGWFGERKRHSIAAKKGKVYYRHWDVGRPKHSYIQVKYKKAKGKRGKFVSSKLKKYGGSRCY